MQDLRPLSYVVISVSFFLASITIAARIYVRGFSTRTFGIDDWAMTVTAVSSIAQQGLLYFFLKFGGGLHLEVVEVEHPEWLLILTKGLLVEEFWYVWMQFCVKMCFLLFYIRLSKTPTFRIALWAVISFHCLSTIAIWLLYGLQCIPLTAFYDPTSYPDVKCLSSSITYFIPYSLNLATDIFVLILPLPVIWTLQMPIKRRIAVSAVLTTGGSAILVSGLRYIVLWQFATASDFTWTLGKMVIISNLEMQVAIIAANMPAIKAFWTLWRIGRLGPGMGVDISTGGSNSRGTRRTENDIELSKGMRGRAKITSKAQANNTLTMTESEEKLFKDKHGRAVADSIRVNYDFQMSE